MVCRGCDELLHYGKDPGEHRLGQQFRRELAAGDLGCDHFVSVGAREAGREQALPDLPLLERVEFDRQCVLHVVAARDTGDAEALAKERPRRMLNEPDEVVEFEQGFRFVRQRRGQERRRVDLAVRECPRTLQRDPVEAPCSPCHQRAWIEVPQRRTAAAGVRPRPVRVPSRQGTGRFDRRRRVVRPGGRPVDAAGSSARPGRRR